jgi:hypothetical protein
MILRIVAGVVIATATFGSTISIDTASLEGNANAPFTLDFQFSDGSGTGDGNNTITLSDFNLAGGSLTLTSESGGVTVDDTPFEIQMTDISFFNESQFRFVPGATLTFDLSTTSNADVGTPDTFTLAILDGSLNDLPTSNPDNGVALIEYDFPTIDPSAGAQLLFAGTIPNSDGVTIPPPVVVTHTPEPAGLFWIVPSILILLCIRQVRLRNCAQSRNSSVGR